MEQPTSTTPEHRCANCGAEARYLTSVKGRDQTYYCAGHAEQALGIPFTTWTAFGGHGWECPQCGGLVALPRSSGPRPCPFGCRLRSEENPS